MAIIYNTSKGKYWKIRESSVDVTNKTCGCLLDIYRDVCCDDVLDTQSMSWKGDNMPLTENYEGNFLKYEIYKLITNRLVGSVYHPDKDEGFYPKIYNYVNKESLKRHFHDINYKTELTVKLYPKRTFIKGELNKVEYYIDELMTDKILIVDIAYNRDAIGFATDRDTTRTWINEDNEENIITKTTHKNYNSSYLDPIKEGILRRDNIIKGLHLPILNYMLATITGYTEAEIFQLGRDFLKTHKIAFQSFIDENHKGALDDITNATDFWLDNNIGQMTIREFILNELDII